MDLLLGIANVALQYKRGKHTGLVGIFGIAIALLCVFQWNHISPVLNTLGVIHFFDKLGLIKHNSPGLTGFNVLMSLVGLYFLLLLATLILFAIVAAIGMASQSLLVGKIVLILLFIVVSPFILLYIAGYEIYYLFNKEMVDNQIVEKQKNIKTIPQLVEDNSKLLSREQALQFINRLPTLGDTAFMLGITKENEIYMIMPRPIGLTMYEVNIGDLACEKLEIEKFNENKHKIVTGLYKPQMFMINQTTHNLNKLETKFTFLHETHFVKFLLPVNIDFKKFFKNITNCKAFESFIQKTNKLYFGRKASLTKLISNAELKEEFDELVKQIKYLDANNEEIIKMMYESESKLENVQGE